jgi:hypothetical protein
MMAGSRLCEVGRTVGVFQLDLVFDGFHRITSNSRGAVVSLWLAPVRISAGDRPQGTW